MRKSLLFLLGAAMVVPQAQAVTNQAVNPQTGSSGNRADALIVPFTATGNQFEKNEYNQIAVPADAAYSIGIWYYPNGTGGVYDYNHIFAVNPHQTECITWTHFMLSCDADGNYFFNVKNNDGGNMEGDDWDTTTTYSYGSSQDQPVTYCMGPMLHLGQHAMSEWHHVIISVDNANKKLAIYFDGELDKEVELANPLIFSESNYFQFGYFGTNNNKFDEVQFFNRALNADDAKAAYVNAADVQGIASIYTLNAVAEGTTGTFNNELIGGVDVKGIFTRKTYSAWWGIPYNYYNTTGWAEYAPAMVDGRDVSALTTSVKVNPVANGTLTISPVDDATALNEGDNTIPVASSYVVSATPADGYALVALTAKTANGEVVLTNGQQITVLGNTEISAKFSNDFKVITVNNELEIPYTLYHRGIVVAPQEDGSYELLNGETYKIAFTVPFDKVINGITVDGNEIAAADNACEFTVADNTTQIIVNGSYKETVTVTINQPMIDGAQAGTLTVTGWNGEIANGGKAVLGDQLTMSYVPNDGYRFRHYMINGELTAAATLTADADVTLSVDAQAGNEYPAMTHTYTGSIGQQNRYIKSMAQVGGEVLFNAETADELGAEYFPGPANTYLPDGALVNKTGIRAGHFQIDQATKEFAFVFTPWTDAIITPSGSYNTELRWTKYAVYVDWNNDGDFTDEGELAARDDQYPANYDDPTCNSKTISVPSGLAMGTYRMRLVFYEPGDANWYETLFETCQIRNGVAYDFDIDVASDSYDQARTVSVAANFAEGGKVEITGVPDQEEGATTVTTAYKYITAVATPNEGVSFINWSTADGTQLTTETTYAYNGTEDAEFVANFGYVITTEVDGNGRLSIASGSDNYTSGAALAYNSEITITPVPDQGYELTTLTVNDQEVTPASDGTYTFKLTANTNVKAVFGVHTYTITYSATGQGSIAVGADYDSSTHTVLDVIESGAEAADDNLIFVLATPKGTNQINYIKYIDAAGEHVLYHIDGSGTLEVAPEYSDDAEAWYTPSKSIGAVIMGGLDDYNILVDFSGDGSGINGVELDAANGVVEYYNLQGVKVAAENLAPGFYIARQGNKAVKVLINK